MDKHIEEARYTIGKLYDIVVSLDFDSYETRKVNECISTIENKIDELTRRDNE